MKSAFIFPVETAESPAALFTRLQEDKGALLLDSCPEAAFGGRYSYIAADPAETISAKDGRVTIETAQGRHVIRADPFGILKARLETYKGETQPGLPPFQGGAAGFFGYDLGRTIERLPSVAAPASLPDMVVGFYDTVIAFDHQQRTCWIIIHAKSREDAQKRHDALVPRLRRPFAVAQPFAVTWQAEQTQDVYQAAVQTVIDYIHAGDIFQANLSQRFRAELPAGFSPFGHYLTLRRVNPAPFSAYYNFGGGMIASASPERFLKVRGRAVESRPIKGTRPRLADADRDTAAARALTDSAKDRAENTMIVDLLRNDLSKVCEDFSVDVPQLCGLESFASVHHLVSIVTGMLRADRHPVDLLRACFPGGSITGAPKIRAMEIIEELEPQRRGPYCGALGFIGYDGAMDTSILIRTLVYEGNQVSFNAGGGIVADSDPAAEYQETLDKAAGLFRSFDAYAATDELKRA